MYLLCILHYILEQVSVLLTTGVVLMLGVFSVNRTLYSGTDVSGAAGYQCYVIIIQGVFTVLFTLYSGTAVSIPLVTSIMLLYSVYSLRI